MLPWCAGDVGEVFLGHVLERHGERNVLYQRQQNIQLCSVVAPPRIARSQRRCTYAGPGILLKHENGRTTSRTTNEKKKILLRGEVYLHARLVVPYSLGFRN